MTRKIFRWRGVSFAFSRLFPVPAAASRRGVLDPSKRLRDSESTDDDGNRDREPFSTFRLIDRPGSAGRRSRSRSRFDPTAGSPIPGMRIAASVDRDSGPWGPGRAGHSIVDRYQRRPRDSRAVLVFRGNAHWRRSGGGFASRTGSRLLSGKAAKIRDRSEPQRTPGRGGEGTTGPPRDIDGVRLRGNSRL